MNLRDLEYFVTLVEYRNYTRVAEKFSVSQPTVTQAIQRLEKNFETKLVEQDRRHQATIITRTGLLLYKNAQQILKYRDLAQIEIQHAKTQRIKVGLPPIIGTLYFPQVAQKMLQTGLLKKTDIVESGSDELLRKLRGGEIDIALLGSIQPIDFAEIESIPLGSRPFGIMVSTKHPLAARTSVSFRELKDEKFISLSGKYVHPLAFKAYCEYAGIKPEIIYETPDIAWEKSLVRANVGIGLIVEDVALHDVGLKVLQIDDPVPFRFNISAAVRANYVLSKLEEQFLNISREMRI